MIAGPLPDMGNRRAAPWYRRFARARFAWAQFRAPILTSFTALLERNVLIIRNYWVEDCHNHSEKLLFAPLLVTKAAHETGYQGHCGSLTDDLAANYFKFGKEPAQRQTLLYFSSSHRVPDRTSFVEAAQTTGLNSTDNNNKIVLKYGSGDDVVQLNVDPSVTYAQALSDTKYAAVLKGNVAETWRFTECLFCGAIPFLQQAVYDYYRPWLPASLMDLLPSYDDDGTAQDDVQSKQQSMDAEQATAVRAAARQWLTEVRNDIVNRIRQEALSPEPKRR